MVNDKHRCIVHVQKCRFPEVQLLIGEREDRPKTARIIK